MIPPRMTGPSDEQSWTRDFGLDARVAPDYIRSEDKLDAAVVSVPQAHAIRRAFAELGIDGVLCVANAPTAYFKWMEDVRAATVRELQRRTWNQGLAPVLVVVSRTQVHIYSSLALPARDEKDLNNDGRWIETLDRVTQLLALRELVTGLESGEFFRIHAQSFDPERRVDRRLLANIGDARSELASLTKREGTTGWPTRYYVGLSSFVTWWIAESSTASTLRRSVPETQSHCATSYRFLYHERE
jgi:hypothetical protein